MIVEQLFHIKINADMSSSDFVLAEYFLRQKQDLANITLKVVVMDTGLSKSTIVRFFQTLKQTNFTQFIYAYQTEITSRKRRERVLIQSRETEKEVLFINQAHHDFIKVVVKQILKHRRLVVLGELRDILMAEPFLPHLFDLGIECDVIWDSPNGSERVLSKESFYLLLMSHYTLSEFTLKANEVLSLQANRIIECNDYGKAVVAYPSAEAFMFPCLQIPRYTRPVDKKLYLLSLFGELHKQLLYESSTL